ncbi:MAG: hypothetical protein AABX82_03505 [Nanoarchaeota archaeon]
MSKATEATISESRKAKRAGTESRMYRDGLGNTAKDYIRRGKNKSAYGKISYSDK